jgi:hypothetical protein
MNQPYTAELYELFRLTMAMTYVCQAYRLCLNARHWNCGNPTMTTEQVNGNPLSFAVFTNTVQLHLVQKSEGTVQSWTPFQAMMRSVFDDDISTSSKVRLCALSFKADDD